jgi:hypothetical protein
LREVKKTDNSLKVFGYDIESMEIFLENSKNKNCQQSDTEKSVGILKNSAVLLFWLNISYFRSLRAN